MTERSSVHFIKRTLTRWLEVLDRLEKSSPRAAKSRWYQIDYHIAPWVVAFISALILSGVLVWGNALTIYQNAAISAFAALFVFLLAVLVRSEFPDIARDDDASALLVVIVLTTVLWIKMGHYVSGKFPIVSPFATPVSICALLTTLLFPVRLAVVFSLAVAFVFGVVNGFSLDITLLGAIGGVTMVAAAAKARTAHHVARAGLMVALAQAGFVLLLSILRGWGHHETWIAMASAFVSGVLAAFFSLGALPYLESLFSRISNIRLLELADVNHPLLRRMAIEAPGTYHHSMIVATLAAEAAASVGANSLLARAGAYFHDIGKMAKAEYFIENQGAFGNPHDRVAPSLSKLVITAHVKEGIALGKAYKLDPQILSFIPQHHGTSQIEYFYRKALKMKEGVEDDDQDPIAEETYRYPGPKPQSREAGIVMLADSVEAASRTLEEPNHQRYKDLVYKIINKKFFDGQLNEAPLTLRDLHTIAERFVATLVSINHNRIPYPESEPGAAKERTEGLSPPK